MLRSGRGELWPPLPNWHKAVVASVHCFNCEWTVLWTGGKKKSAEGRVKHSTLSFESELCMSLGACLSVWMLVHTIG
eukprot:878540-Alexandrium_andersonii.AAC.1